MSDYCVVRGPVGLLYCQLVHFQTGSLRIIESYSFLVNPNGIRVEHNEPLESMTPDPFWSLESTKALFYSGFPYKLAILMEHDDVTWLRSRISISLRDAI